ncbi:MAG: Imm26 family immunity protein [Verrucomicrobiota bacterium]|jgi:hypothetical protein
MKLPYGESTCFAVPLRGGGFATGVVARATKKGKIVLCYFFGPRLKSVPELNQVIALNPATPICVIRVGDLGLLRGEWPIIGELTSWNRLDWPMPVFIRRGTLPPYVNWLVYYSDIDPAKRLREVREANDRPELRRDSLFGSGAAEILLSQLLCQ